ncbi:hypothetical protein [Halovivax cerinus]|uniref:Uncharacterized protein n=1 Tax=Halovivax cerinus TaxID=1487865 RepID=A0ABD5NL31_9EURY|nr:hypothetical protein [Halovivax cerinus]
MSDVDESKRAADALSEVTLAMEDVDLNALLDEDVLTLLECKQTLTGMCLRYRRDQQAAERNAEGDNVE